MGFSHSAMEHRRKDGKNDGEFVITKDKTVNHKVSMKLSNKIQFLNKNYTKKIAYFWCENNIKTMCMRSTYRDKKSLLNGYI